MPKKIDHEARKEKILHTALRVFGREGYRDSNLSLIASECGISRPTIYQYFKDKEESLLRRQAGHRTDVQQVRHHAWSSDGDYITASAICLDIMHTASERRELTSPWM